MDFERLMVGLPDCPGPAELPLKTSGAFAYVPAGPQVFVAPQLAAFEGIENDPDPAVFLISAAGAVGKSTLAATVAANKQAPRWDLAAQGPVATHSLSGRLTESFGYDGLVRLFGELSAGRMFVVIDALDEARVKTTEESFFAFLRDVAKLAGTSGPAPRFVLLGRTQVIETAWLVLKEESVACAVYTIEPFDEESARRFIDERVRVARDRQGAVAMAQHPGPYVEARDTVLERLRQAIVGEREGVDQRDIRDFLGYAPVLDAVATLLAGTSNFVHLRETFGREHSGAENPEKAVAILEDIIETVLVREQREKFVPNTMPVLAKVAAARGIQIDSDSFMRTLYTPDEQAERLVGYFLKTDQRARVEIAPGLSDAYEEQVAAFLVEHPFVRESRPANTVFESFLFARALVNGGEHLRGGAERYLEGDDYKPSSLLARFYFAELGRTGGPLLVPLEHIGILYDSLRAGETDTRRVRLALDGGDPTDEIEPGGTLTAEVEFEVLPHAETAARPIRPGLVTEFGKSSVLRFSKSIRNVEVSLPTSVALGAAGRELVIGPAVHIDCDELWILAERVTVAAQRGADAQAEDPGVILFAQTYNDLGTVTRRPVVEGRLEVSWPGAAVFPWTDFAVEEPARALHGPVRDAYLRFRRIASVFRSHKKGALARYRGKLEHQRVLKGPAGEALLRRMTRDGVLELVENFYYWNASRAAELVGVTWVDMRRGVINDRVAGYLEDFVREHRELFAD